MTARLASQPKRPPRRLGHVSGLTRCLDEISGRLLDQICRVTYSVETLHDEIVNPHKPFGSVKFGAFLVSNDQLCELHGDDGSSMRGDVPANRLSETLFSRYRQMAVSHTQMAYSMPSWTPFRLKFAGQVTSSLSSGLCGEGRGDPKLNSEFLARPTALVPETALQLRLVEPRGFGRPNRATISHGRSGADKVAHWRLLLCRAHVHVDGLSAEPRRQEFLDNRFEVINHGTATHVAFYGFPRLAAGNGRQPVGGAA